MPILVSHFEFIHESCLDFRNKNKQKVISVIR